MSALYLTPHRKAFLRAVAHSRSRVVLYTSTREAYDLQENVRVTARLTEAFRAGWIEPVPDEDLWDGAEPRTRVVFYRVTALGRTAMNGGN